MSEVITRPAAGQSKVTKATRSVAHALTSATPHSPAIDAACRKAAGVLQTLTMLAASTNHSSQFPLIPELGDADCVFSHVHAPSQYTAPEHAPADIAGQLRMGFDLLDEAVLRIHEHSDVNAGTALHFNALACQARALTQRVLHAYANDDITELELLSTFVYAMGERSAPAQKKSPRSVISDTPTSEAGDAGADLIRDATYLIAEMAEGVISLAEESRAVGDHRMWGMLNCFGHRINNLNDLVMGHLDNDSRTMMEAHNIIFGHAKPFGIRTGGPA